uniref:Ig-like domain-containing protein n=1 Tax=Sparus aurata TaxID=8175 RepID=A0A671WEV2_SPAAU
MFSSSSECKGADRVIQPTEDVIAAEGDTVTLDCKFETSNPSYYLFWYKQDGNNSPKFILSRIQRDDGNSPDEFKERFSSTLDSTSKSGPLKIQKLQLSDSAVYYCALQPTVTGNTKTLLNRKQSGERNSCFTTGFIIKKPPLSKEMGFIYSSMCFTCLTHQQPSQLHFCNSFQ